MAVPAVLSDALPFGKYESAPGHFDEVYAKHGVLRPHWKRFVELTKRFGPDEFARRWEQAQRFLHQSSLASAEIHDLRERDRTWALDPLPLLIPAHEWKTVSAGLQQRAKLLDLVLRDLYGPQNLLRINALPPEVVFRHPGFQLPYHGQKPRLGHFIHFYAADLARSPEGKWWVLSEHTESPSGAGFALENRITLSRMLPEVFRQCQVERLAQYFIAVREELARIAPIAAENPRIVLLSEEAGTRDYFEDAYLARYLGYTLVEGGDLAVRNQRVFLKTLGGLLPVDVLMRRPPSDQCDPLELSSNSAFGVAGLMQTAQTGAVSVANALGSGLMESPAFMAFLPNLCRTLLDEELLMPGIATWWCGDPDRRRYVISRIDELDIRHAYRSGDATKLYVASIDKLNRKELIARIEDSPNDFVAQERVSRSMAPVWIEDELRGAYVQLRAFATRTADSYAVMQGGLARLSSTQDILDWWPGNDERSKDAWVLAEGPVAPISLLRPIDETVLPRRRGADLPSRVAENLYWLGRQAERADALARLLRTVCQRLTSEANFGQLSDVPLLLRVLAEKGQIEPGFVVAEMSRLLPSIEKLLPSAVFDDAQVGTLRFTVSQLARLASTVRDRLSLDSSRTIRQMDEQFWPATGQPDLADALEKIDALLANLSAFTGLVMESMTRTQTWHFLDLGRRLERGMQTIGLIRSIVKGRGATEQATLEALLEVADSIMTYRSRYVDHVQLGLVLDLLLTDELNPRSVAFQLVACRDHVAKLPRDSNGARFSPEQDLALALLDLIRNVDSQKLAREYVAGDAKPLDDVLFTIESTLPRLSDAVSHKYLIHTGPTQRLAEIDVTADDDS